MPKLSWSRKKCPYCATLPEYKAYRKKFLRDDAKECPYCKHPLVVLPNRDVGQVYDNLPIEKSRQTYRNWLNIVSASKRKGFKTKIQKIIREVNDEKKTKDVQDQVILATFFNLIENEYDDISGTADEIIVDDEPISSQDFSNVDQQETQASEKISSLKAIAKQIGRVALYFAIIGNSARLMMPILSQGILEGSNRAEAIVGGVPLYNIQRKERARSDRKVKYRAIGDVFLAHQKGTKDSLRLDGRLSGPLRYVYLWALLSLQQKGETRIDKVTSSKIGNLNLTNIQDSYKDSLEDIKEAAGKKEINYEHHHTYPIITRFSILFDMYLQTIEWHKTLESGKECIDFHLLFRKWIPNTGYKVFNPVFNKDGKFSGDLKIGLMTEDRYKWHKHFLDALWKGIWAAGEVCPRLIFGIDEKNVRELDRGAWTNVGRLVKSYNVTKYLGKDFFERIKFSSTSMGLI